MRRKKGKEIAIVIKYINTKNALIEVKYREGTPIGDDDMICELCNEAAASIIITKNMHDFGAHNTKSGKDLIRIPAYAFCIC